MSGRDKKKIRVFRMPVDGRIIRVRHGTHAAACIEREYQKQVDLRAQRVAEHRAREK